MSDQSVAIVTGGASGIGLGIATALMAEDYDVFVLDNDLHHVDDYNTNHPLSRARLCDVSDASAVATEVDGVLHVAGRIDPACEQCRDLGTHGVCRGNRTIGVAEDVRRWLDRGLQCDASSRAYNEGAVVRCNHQYCLQCRPHGLSKPFTVCGGKVGFDRAHKNLGDGARTFQSSGK